ncbi:MAG: 4-(cytidine 5'-diphospho)-2-C-methyl-D-erythritol kinase, partial [Eubacteriales bacterium]
MSAVTISAPAKFNLYLGVTGRAENGYHTVETVMQALTLCDVITVSPGVSSDKPIRIICTEPNVP